MWAVLAKLVVPQLTLSRDRLANFSNIIGVPGVHDVRFNSVASFGSSQLNTRGHDRP